MRWVRRLVVVGLLVAAIAVARDRRRRAGAPASAAPVWPPLPEPGPAPAPATARASRATTAVVDAPSWVPPVDGRCPDDYPVKTNANSGIFHVPGGRFYERTIPERCYATSAHAERDGYRAAKA
jgi:hypothetical protein